MMDTIAITPIGGAICSGTLDPGLLPGDGQILTHANREFLWKLFQQIAVVWKNVDYDSSNLKSSWLEMVDEKSRGAPSYTGEYINAIHVVTELVGMYGQEQAYYKLFLANGIPVGPPNIRLPPTTRLAHAKRYVVDEFITVQVMMSGFKHFGGKNYHGYVKGSRYNRHAQVRVYRPQGTEP
jgi:hypothetical protein